MKRKDLGKCPTLKTRKEVYALTGKKHAKPPFIWS